MDLGFETIGNACIIAHDRGPVLATDPWLTGTAYFGSWRLSHAVPREQQENVAKCRYLWLSHGHPDHLSLESLERLRDKTILLADHYGGRIARDLQGLGFSVRVLKCGEWFPISDRVRVAALANYNQDATLVMDLDGHLLIDANDAGNRGSGRFLAQQRHRFTKRTILACLTGYGDADMIHFFDEQGRLVPPNAARKEPCGPGIAAMLDHYDLQYFAPSSSMHRYNRTDSGWADDYATPVDAHADGFDGGRRTCLPAFVQFDLHTGCYEKIGPMANDQPLQAPEVFGDDWSTPLEFADVKLLRDYLHRVELLKTCIGYVNFRVGGKDHRIELRTGKFRRGVTFEAPRHSLMTAVRYEIFDDLLIGNFMKTTLHGSWPASDLHPDFTPYVRYADNGRARTLDELKAYFAAYRQRLTPLERLRLSAKKSSTDLFRTLVPRESLAWKVARRLTVRR